MQRDWLKKLECRLKKNRDEVFRIFVFSYFRIFVFSYFRIFVIEQRIKNKKRRMIILIYNDFNL